MAKTWKRWRPIIKREMENQGVTIYTICTHTGLSWITVNNWLTKQSTNPGLAKLEQMLDILGLEMCLRRKKDGVPSKERE